MGELAKLVDEGRLLKTDVVDLGLDVIQYTGHRLAGVLGLGGGVDGCFRSALHGCHQG